ncbi:putative PurR-regulated permease PerM [Kribbella orskensis]|uniref:PurR-regulated permease PerM n=1 Tax=Kribbella orskensis TaxID=2512216 RepID=A0ABY2BHQ1_9ACTN|nr:MULTISPECIES: AI-2E family transporter [Kribbella]TCN38235.1 putative PurR-regulated permease PerM [Kribbella sp. VKM Ac-2500]TCO20235.1 putative PurR-regulated permease PerM [Kribbella orskensis]
MTPAGDDNSTKTTPDIREIEEAARDAKAAAAEAEAAADDAEESAEHADESAELAETSATEAGKSAELADRSAEVADRSAEAAEVAERADGVARPDDGNLVGEMLIEERHPDVGMGRPGPPLQRSNPFVFGFFAALGVLVAWGLWNALGQAKSVLILLVVSMFIAVGLNPLVEWFMRRGLKRGLAVAVVFVLMILAVSGVGFAIVPVVSEQINNLIRNAPDWLDLLTKSRTLEELNNRYDFITKAKDYIQDPALAQRAFGGVLGVGKVVANALFSAFTILILTLYFLASLPSVKRAAYSLVPSSRRQRVAILGDEVLGRVGGYVSGQFLVAACAGFFMFVFLEIIGLNDYALALAIVVMFTAFIPMVGGLIGVVLVAAIGFTDSLWTGIACLVYGVIYQQIENYLIAPRIMRRAVDIPGAVTVIAALLGGALLGVVGALLAIPTAAAVLLIIREVWIRKADAS